MIRQTLFLFALLLSACAPTYQPPAGGSGEILPAEAQRIIDQATATAAAMATRGGLATEAARIAIATSTAAGAQTREALQIEQTRSAMRITEAAAQAMIDRQRADQTLAAMQTQAAATPTAEALRNRIRAEQIEAQQTAAQAEARAAFWNMAAESIVALLWIAGLSLIVYLIGNRALIAYGAYLATKAAIAREAFKILPPGHYADYQPGQGYRVLPMPALPAPDPRIIDIEPDPPKRSDWAAGWRRAYRLLAFWGDQYGFGIRDLGPEGINVISDPDWRKLTKILRDRGVLALRLLERNGQTYRGLAWADNWNLARFMEDYSAGRLVLPLPSAEDPPYVAGEIAPQHNGAALSPQPHNA